MEGDKHIREFPSLAGGHQQPLAPPRAARHQNPRVSLAALNGCGTPKAFVMLRSDPCHSRGHPVEEARRAGFVQTLLCTGVGTAGQTPHPHFRWMYWRFSGGETEAPTCHRTQIKGSPCQGYTAINDALILLLAVH